MQVLAGIHDPATIYTHNGENEMNVKTLINELIERGFSTDAATILGNRFPFYKSDAIYDIASEGTKEELMKDRKSVCRERV